MNTTYTKNRTDYRPLAVIGRIVLVELIDGADRINRADVVCGQYGRWSGVVDKSVLVDDKVVVFLQDAVLPPNPRWAFMEKNKWRVRMVRFKGVPSECLVFVPPLGIYGQIGDDVTELFGVTKYTKPIPANMAGVAVDNFPAFIPKTDEPNFQTVLNRHELMQQPWYVTEKADGTSCTVWNDEHGVHVCSRNWELENRQGPGITTDVYWQMAHQYQLGNLPKWLAVQFEIIGPKIQGNPPGLVVPEIRVFSVYDIKLRQYLPYPSLIRLCSKYQLPSAHLLAAGDQPCGDYQLRALADIVYDNGQPGEGVVIRATDSSWSFKVINLNYKEKA